MTIRVALLAAFFVTLLSAPASSQDAAAEPVFQGTHSQWRVFTRGTGSERVCYALATPRESLPSNLDHGSVFFLVSSWASGAADEQPSFMAGYALRPDSPPRVRVGSDRFAMFVSEREGFLEVLRDEDRLVGAMRRGSVMRVEAVSGQGNATSYEFSLSGVTAALRQVEQLC